MFKACSFGGFSATCLGTTALFIMPQCRTFIGIPPVASQKRQQSPQVIVLTSLLINSHWEGCLFGLPVCFTRETGERMEHV